MIHRILFHRLLLFFLPGVLLLTSCGDSRIDTPSRRFEISGLEPTYYVPVGSTLTLEPGLKYTTPKTTITWLLDGATVGSDPVYTYTAPATVGTHRLILTLREGSMSAHAEMSIVVEKFEALTAEAGVPLQLTPTSGLSGATTYRWTVREPESGAYRLEDETLPRPRFIALPGQYRLQLHTDLGEEEYRITVVQKSTQPTTAYPDRVYDFTPAPGQFVGRYPRLEGTETTEEIHADLLRILREGDGLISLGGWGGSITFGFDHTVVNVAGKPDLKIEGNAFWSTADFHREGLKPDTYGSSEPGIVRVAYDANHNGIPDDEWYEIKGSGHADPITEYWYPFVQRAGLRTGYTPGYEITYHRPSAEHPHQVLWADNQGDSGVLETTYPTWIKGDRITFRGTRLPDNGILLSSGDQSMYLLCAFDYGYVDNRPNDDTKGYIDLDWAVDQDGNPAHLLGIDFVQVYTGVRQINGILGENSTELSAALDLHHPTK